ncbi:MAG: hypothetical protein ACJ758_03355, partial [Actinomycetota bacterium]
LAMAPDGKSVYVTGWTWFEGSNHDYVTEAIDTSNGDIRWIERYSNRKDHANDLAVSPSADTIFVTGESKNGDGNLDFATVAYAAD